VCLWSIQHSVRYCGLTEDEFEILIVSNPVGELGNFASKIYESNDCTLFNGVRIIYDDSDMPVFNKSKLLNIGIDKSNGDILTFLDCDMIVGEKWIKGVEQFEKNEKVVRVCYRVAQLDKTLVKQILTFRHLRKPLIKKYFCDYSKYKVTFEAYRFPWRNRCEPSYPIWGNSQYSIPRNKLDNIRYDETFIGRGHEDIEMNTQIWHRYKNNYKGYLNIDPDYCLFHMEHDKGPWGNPKYGFEQASRLVKARECNRFPI